MSRFETNAVLTDRRDVNEDLIVVKIQPEFPELSFLPGQYAELAIIEDHSVEEPQGERKNKLVRKAYSIASSPGDTEGLELYITLVSEGELTPKLWRLNPGDRVWVNPKIKGKFTLDAVPPQKDLVLAATGTGIAPFISMLRTHIEAPPWRNVAVFHGVRFAKDLGYHQELMKLADSYQRVRYVPTVSREDHTSGWAGARGRLQALFHEDVFEHEAGFPLDPVETQIMLCGNPEMIDSMVYELSQRGHTPHKKKAPGNIHFERYW